MQVRLSKQIFESIPFEEAFRTARRELGAFGLFLWNGQPFHTMYEEEITSLSEDRLRLHNQMILETLVQHQLIAPIYIPTVAQDFGLDITSDSSDIQSASEFSLSGIGSFFQELGEAIGDLFN